MDMNSGMELRRATWVAALRLAMIMSTAAALGVVALSSLGDLSPTLVVLCVAMAGFALSWIQTGRILQGRRRHGHRVTAVQLRRSPAV